MEWCFRIYLFIVFGFSLVAPFSWSDCGTAQDPIRILSLDISSNQTTEVFVTGRGKVAVNITEPIRANIKIQKKFFWGWAPVPCIENVGSCNYADICQLSPYKDGQCPPDFTRNDLPCRCPILQGQYQSKNFPIDLSIWPPEVCKGKYRMHVTLYKSNLKLMCLLIYMTL